VRPWIAGGCAAVLLALGVTVAGNTDGTAVDRAFSSWVHATFARWVLWVLAAPTEPLLLVAVAALLAVVAARRRDRARAAAAVLGPALTSGLNFLVFKPVFDRRFTGYLAYPSGHMALLCAVLTLLVPLAPRYLVPVVSAIAAGAAIALVGLDFHYLTDVAGGLCCGVAVTLTVGLLADRRGAVNRERHSA
jgi:membrane-associated phospholipid phosphatase